MTLIEKAIMALDYTEEEAKELAKTSKIYASLEELAEAHPLWDDEYLEEYRYAFNPNGKPERDYFGIFGKHSTVVDGKAYLIECDDIF